MTIKKGKAVKGGKATSRADAPTDPVNAATDTSDAAAKTATPTRTIAARATTVLGSDISSRKHAYEGPTHPSRKKRVVVRKPRSGSPPAADVAQTASSKDMDTEQIVPPKDTEAAQATMKVDVDAVVSYANPLQDEPIRPPGEDITVKSNEAPIDPSDEGTVNNANAASIDKPIISASEDITEKVVFNANEVPADKTVANAGEPPAVENTLMDMDDEELMKSQGDLHMTPPSGLPVPSTTTVLAPHTDNDVVLEDASPQSPKYSMHSSTQEALPFVQGSFDDIIQNAMKTVAIRPVAPGQPLIADVVGPSRPPHLEAPPQNAPQVPPIDGSPHSYPSVNTVRRDGKAPMAEFCPITPEGIPIVKSSNHEDAGVIQGLLESVVLDGHQEYYRTVPSDPQSLLTFGMKEIFWGLSDMVRAKRIVDEKLLQSKEQISSMKLKLVDAEKVVAKKQSIIDDLRLSLTYASRTGTEELEKQYAAYRGSSERTIGELQRELKHTNAQLAACTAQLFASRETRAILQMENDNLRNELRDFKDYNAGVEGRHSALMLLLANARQKHQEWVNERSIIITSNQALHKEIVCLEGFREENRLLWEEIDEMKRCVAKYNSAIAKLISESGRMDSIPLDAPPTDPRRFLLEAWHPEEARLHTVIADLQASIPARLRERFAGIEQDSFDRAMRMSIDSYSD